MPDDILVVQLTGRLHFGAARALQSVGRLGGLLTDFRIPELFRPVARHSPTLRRYCIELPASKLFGNPMVGLRYRADLRRSPRHAARPHIVASRRLAAQAVAIAEDLGASTVLAFDIQALETFARFAGSGRRLVLEQCVAPRRSQIGLLERLPSGTGEGFRRAQLERLAAREEAEWRMADLVLCPSAYVRDELLLCRVPEAKLRVVPYGFSAGPERAAGNRRRQPGPLRAVFVGAVGKRKGADDAAAAVNALGGRVRLDIFGPADDLSFGDLAGPWITLHGKVPFERVRRAYGEADLFLLPSHLEGSASVTYEALAHGLPVIATPQTGSVVDDGQEGFIVPAGDPAAVAERLERLAADPSLVEAMSRAARRRSADFGLDAYGERLCAVL